MNIAYVMTEKKGGTDRFLTEIAKTAISKGLGVAGIVQENTPRLKSHRCDMDVQVLPNGPTIRISQDLGPNARGCALNPDALERSVVEVQKMLTENTDLLIINKFGKHESEGRGFRPLIADALALDVPVLVGLNSLNQKDFKVFADGLAQELHATQTDVMAWILESHLLRDAV